MWKIIASYKVPYQRKGTEESVFCISCIPQTLNLASRRIASQTLACQPAGDAEVSNSVWSGLTDETRKSLSNESLCDILAVETNAGGVCLWSSKILSLTVSNSLTRSDAR